MRATTWRAHERNTRLYLLPSIGKKKLAQLGVRDVRLMIDRMRADGVGARTTQYVHATLRVALEHAHREELVSRNVAKMVRVERPKAEVKQPLSVEEARTLLDATTDDSRHALWVLLVMLGLRRSEVCGLRWEHVDFEARTLRIHRHGTPLEPRNLTRMWSEMNVYGHVNLDAQRRALDDQLTRGRCCQ
ncbi:hypothetical protein GCM10010464_80640 [Pseudonocardia yunnanensis]|uniref:Tyrosine-type recombinase/integrase n=1 Tax=Pseudonocardia yunnanensis TaxID=58107 RepID=A0ABW4ENR7_9PSEU